MNNEDSERIDIINAPAEEYADDIYIFENQQDIGKPMGFFERFISIFLSPVKLIENLAHYPKLGAVSVYLLIIMGISAVLALKISPIITNAMSNALVERYGTDVFNMAAAANSLEQFTPLAFVSGLLGGISSVFVGSAVGALVILLITKIMRGNATFKHYFALNLHLSVITYIGGIISSAIMLMTGTFMVFTSLAPIFMPTGNAMMPMFNFLSSIELFSIWSTVLTVIGIKKMNYNFSTAKALVAGILIYALTLLVSFAAASSTMFFFDISQRFIQ